MVNKDTNIEAAFLKGLFNAPNIIILTQTNEGFIRNPNRFCVDTIGFSVETLQKLKFSQVISCDGNEVLDLYNALESKKRVEFEHTLLCRKGEQKEFLWSHTMLDKPHDDGSIILTVGIDITERSAAARENAWIAAHDPLTGLLSRCKLFEEMDRAIDEVDRSQSPVSIIFVDLDGFKSVNDSCGHAAGDLLLKEFADLLRKGTRKIDIVSRIGGDEFVLILKNTSQSGAKDFCSHLLSNLKNFLFTYDDKSYGISASIGIATIPTLESASAEVLLSRSDAAMYEAKRSGKGRYQVYSDQLRHKRSFNRPTNC